jgi:hypothetical protein
MSSLVVPRWRRLRRNNYWPSFANELDIVCERYLTLHALERFIGSMGRDRWVYLDNAGALRDEFWRAFAHYAG